MSTDVRSRLLSKAALNPDTGCLEWKASWSGDGYGRFWFEGRMQNAHRVSLQLHTGEPIPVGALVRHLCDNKACINPDHLTTGTHADNMRDRQERRRFSRKLHDEDVRAIRDAEGVSQSTLAAQFGVTKQAISLIRTGKRWT